MSKPKISVRTRGPRRWTVSVRELPQAEKARHTFRQGGLVCSAIERLGKVFEFTVDGRLGSAAVEMQNQR